MFHYIWGEMRVSMKRNYLVCYDYGMGGLWGIITADSIQDISELYPELTVFETRPFWMTNDQYASIAKQPKYSLLKEPVGMLLTIINDRHISSM
jgi:hypothetical protein